MDNKVREMEDFLEVVTEYSFDNDYLRKDDLGNVVPNIDFLDSKIVAMYMELSLFLTLLEEGAIEQYYIDMDTNFDEFYERYLEMVKTFEVLRED